jgi:ankyrin repeat protein
LTFFLPANADPGVTEGRFVMSESPAQSVSETTLPSSSDVAGPLPARPSITKLRKLAKERLVQLRAVDPAATLAAAHLAIARECGFASWRALADEAGKAEYERFRAAMEREDVDAVRRALTHSGYVRRKINDPIAGFGGRPVHRAAKNVELMNVLLEFGADINLRTAWEKGPFSVLDYSPEEATRHYLKKGAILTAHAAARLGWIDDLRRMIKADPKVVHEKGGDGQRPLHFAKTTAIADLLLDSGADIDARCDDHHSTAAQYRLVDEPEVTRHLLKRGATPDIFMAARLDDRDLAATLIAEDPACLMARINAPGYAPVPPFNIYNWTLNWYLSPHEVALRFEHQEMYRLLWEASSPTTRLLVACSQADEAAARQVLSEHPYVVKNLKAKDQALLAFSMFYNRPGAVRLMMALGFDPMARGVDGGPLLHAAAWHGQAEIIATLLREQRERLDLTVTDATYHGTALDWAMHGSVQSWVKGGDHAAVVEQLIAAGIALPEKIHTGSAAVRAVLRGHGVAEAKASSETRA